jgi:hypothetical protein
MPAACGSRGSWIKCCLQKLELACDQLALNVLQVWQLNILVELLNAQAPQSLQQASASSRVIAGKICWHWPGDSPGLNGRARIKQWKTQCKHACMIERKIVVS